MADAFDKDEMVFQLDGMPSCSDCGGPAMLKVKPWSGLFHKTIWYYTHERGCRHSGIAQVREAIGEATLSRAGAQ